MKQIPLTQGKIAFVDDSDYEYISQWKWHAKKDGNTFYAKRSSKHVDGKQSTIYMHQVMMNSDDGELVDHKDQNGLNNQRSNLRLATKSQNNTNKIKKENSTSKYIGVHLSSTKIKGVTYQYWKAKIIIDGSRVHLGSFKTELEAAIAYNNAIVKHNLQFNKQNII